MIKKIKSFIKELKEFIRIYIYDICLIILGVIVVGMIIYGITTL